MADRETITPKKFVSLVVQTYAKTPAGQRTAFGKGAQNLQKEVGLKPVTQGGIAEAVGDVGSFTMLAIVDPKAAKKIIKLKGLSEQVVDMALEKGVPSLQKYLDLNNPNLPKFFVDTKKIGASLKKGRWEGSATINRKGEFGVDWTRDVGPGKFQISGSTGPDESRAGVRFSIPLGGNRSRTQQRAGKKRYPLNSTRSPRSQ